MRFEERELKPHAEPIPASELKEGSVYFSLTFVDDEMLIPTMETLIFAGRDLDTNFSGRLYFQDIDSYRNGVRYESAAEGDYATFYECTEDNLNNIFDFEHALDVLLGCSLKRRGIKDVD